MSAPSPQPFDTRLITPDDPFAAVALLTRLPVPPGWFRGTPRGAAAAWAYPLVGILLGLIAGTIALVAQGLGLPSVAVAGLCLGTLILSTGALHEDGLADAVDGLWGGRDRERRLAIMKDSAIGSYGVIALVLSLGLRWVALATLLPLGGVLAILIAVAALSRVPMVFVMWSLPNARDTGLSSHIGRPGGRTVVLAMVSGFLIALLCLGTAAIWISLVLALVALGCRSLARARVGGQTGDILGATQQLCEIAALLTLAALWT